jgi:DNA topoisomerase-1
MSTLAVGQVERKAIEELGLRRIGTSELVIERVASKEGFDFCTADGKRVGLRERRRITALAIPPAWSEVRIAGDGDAHLQAVGRDDAGRLQYIYHSAWEDVRAAAKAFRLIQLGQALGPLRAAIAGDLKNKAAGCSLAVAARLVDLFRLRAGHESYAGEEGGRGVATLLKRHVQVDGAAFRLKFRGKGGKQIEKRREDGELAERLAELRRLRGPRLFKVPSNDGFRPMTAIDLNAYLAQASGKAITAKDFRTLYASATALDRLSGADVGQSPAARRRALQEVGRLIAAELANTPAVVRKSYVHPWIVEKFERGALTGLANGKARLGLSAEESKLIRFFEQEEDRR